MSFIAMIAVAIVAALHVFFAYIEMVKWEEKGHKIVPDFDPEMLRRTKAMAANQGLYNLFLAAGLIWALLFAGIGHQIEIALLFLTFVVIAGLYGGKTVTPKLAIIQAAPAAIALILVLVT